MQTVAETVSAENAARSPPRRRTPTALKDEFLAMLSHELRTPLNAILGWARMLRRHVLARGSDRARPRGRSSATPRAQTQLVEDLLDVSRIMSGKMRLDVQPVELPAIVDNAVATVQPAADAKGVRIADGARSAASAGLGRSRIGCSRWSGTCCRTR